MFKFGFSSEPSDIEEVSAKEDGNIDCCESYEVTLDTIRELAQRNKSEHETISNIFAMDVLKIRSVPTILIKDSESISAAEDSHSDLVPGKYEGGLKVWECTYDLAKFLTSGIDLNWSNKTVLDLGCGAGLLGLNALLQGAEVIFQDYNKEVLELLTGPTVLLNKPDVTSEKVQFYSGDWGPFHSQFIEKRPGVKFDVILSSETIYNPLNYSKLHNVIAELLKPEGVCYLAGKSIYFGVGGSMRAFHDDLIRRGKLEVKTVWSTSEGVAREIYEITHKIV